ncbi:hypothetical protein GALMADRAFT_902958 [Galerina marginata CBS 339.88]|uniref:Uncharacterized protein n=1 Tax=Galerina marginata (strain CBS 339.88) TaxID=685588 RepID=A0A067SJ63_GALM3|nr:hypothetical protein GALMADRAFT_902958 [Galerina marginata CBS 339.88]
MYSGVASLHFPLQPMHPRLKSWKDLLQHRVDNTVSCALHLIMQVCRLHRRSTLSPTFAFLGPSTVGATLHRSALRPGLPSCSAKARSYPFLAQAAHSKNHNRLPVRRRISQHTPRSAPWSRRSS